MKNDMTLAELDTELREFTVGTTGWTADDLDDPAIERLWDFGRYEIIEGVLTQMPAARFDDGIAFLNFLTFIKAHLNNTGDKGKLAIETDVILENMRVPRVDAIYLSSDDVPRQEKANRATRRPRGKYGRIRIVPTLILESVSPGHEAHDRITKRRWYAEAGAPHYWLFDAYAKTVETLVLDGGNYHTEQLARDSDELRPSLFPGLVIPLGKVWE